MIFFAPCNFTGHLCFIIFCLEKCPKKHEMDRWSQTPHLLRANDKELPLPPQPEAFRNRLVLHFFLPCVDLWFLGDHLTFLDTHQMHPTPTFVCLYCCLFSCLLHSMFGKMAHVCRPRQKSEPAWPRAVLKLCVPMLLQALSDQQKVKVQAKDECAFPAWSHFGWVMLGIINPKLDMKQIGFRLPSWDEVLLNTLQAVFVEGFTRQQLRLNRLQSRAGIPSSCWDSTRPWGWSWTQWYAARNKNQLICVPPITWPFQLNYGPWANFWAVEMWSWQFLDNRFVEAKMCAGMDSAATAGTTGWRWVDVKIVGCWVSFRCLRQI